MKRHTVIQGDCFVTDDPDMLLTTVLGSCVAACVFDPQSGVGGMNHFLLSEQERDKDNGRDRLYGSYLMELLLNGLYKRGARKENLKVKLFGGAKMFDSRFDPGKRNSEFITKFMQDERLEVIASSLGGSCGRRIEFQPANGHTRQKMMIEAVEETKVVPDLKDNNHGELELF